MKTRRDTGDWI